MTDWTPLPHTDDEPDELVVHDLGLVPEFTHPLRSALLHRLRDARSAAELADELDVPVTRLYHHLHRLEQLGLVRVVATRRSGAKTERRYRAVARSFRIDPEAAAGRGADEVATVLGALFDAARNDLRREVLAGSIDLAAIDETSVFGFLGLTVAEERVPQLLARLGEMVDELREFEQDHPDTGRGAGGDAAPTRRVRLVVAGFPITD